MKLVRTLVLVAAVSAAPALAQDSPAGPGSGDAPLGPAAGPGDPAKAPEAAAPPAKKERKVDAKAMELIDAYHKLMATPGNAGAKEMKFLGAAEIPMSPEPFGLDARWTEKEGFKFEVSIPESVLAMIPPEAVDQQKTAIHGLVEMAINPYFEGRDRDIDEYDISFAGEPAKRAVSLVAFGPKAKAERQTLHFNAEGVLEKIVVAPKIDPDSPQAAMMAGIDIEATVTHKKRGERWEMGAMTILLPMGEISLTPHYYESPKDSALPKSIDLVAPFTQGQTWTMSFFDYALDGKAVEGTAKAKPAEKKPEPVTPPTPAAPADPAKEPAAPAGPEAK